ncbi:MAG: hypothetical protein J6Y65_01435, partial [Eggerthellaceae bacterium]|nr:hypothetical protein [Eggerthellaceae bacterium]
FINIIKSTTIGYSSVTVDDCDVDCEYKTPEYILLPVYTAGVKYRDEEYTFVINGQTGKVVGKLPASTVKKVLFPMGFYALFAAAFVGLSLLCGFPFEDLYAAAPFILAFIPTAIIGKSMSSQMSSIVEQKTAQQFIVPDKFVLTGKTDVKYKSSRRVVHHNKS